MSNSMPRDVCAASNYRPTAFHFDRMYDIVPSNWESKQRQIQRGDFNHAGLCRPDCVRAFLP
jgi:hypothetical protein